MADHHPIRCDAETGWCRRCWRCGEPSHGLWPYYLCDPCTEWVSPEEIKWMDDATREPGKTSWEMTPMGRPQGQPWPPEEAR